jgi:hypothetical protein
MMGLIMRRRLFAVLFAIPLVASGAAGVVLHVCHSMGGEVVGGCACETQAEHAHAGRSDDGHHAAHEPRAKLQTQPCCSVELSSGGQLLATQEVTWQQVEDAPLVPLTSPVIAVAAARAVCDPGLLRQRAAPNIHGPPIFLRHCSFLN